MVQYKRFGKYYNAWVNKETIKPANMHALLLFQKHFCRGVENLCKIFKH